MGHLQDMSDKMRNEFVSNAIAARNKARRGNNFTYLNEQQRKDLENKGYDEYQFDDGKHECGSSLYCKDIVTELKNTNHYARIVVNPCDIKGCQTYSIWYKGKRYLDPNSGGTEWLYMEFRICDQRDDDRLSSFAIWDERNGKYANGDLIGGFEGTLKDCEKEVENIIKQS